MIEATVQAPADKTRAALADLTTYPEWLPLVSAVTVNDDDSWHVTLKARLGPFARSKRLRMVLDTADTDTEIRFVRAETDGRDHSAWILSADVEPVTESTCTATVHLHYSGTLWSTPLEGALKTAQADATRRLSEYLNG